VLEEQLIEVDVGQDPTEVGTTRLQVGQVDVNGLAAKVFRAAHASHTLVDHGRTEGTVNTDGSKLPA